MSDLENEVDDTPNLDSYLTNEYIQSDMEESDKSVDGYSETESVDLREDKTYQVFSTLLEDNNGNNISSNINNLNVIHKNEFQKINQNLEHLNKSISAVYGLLREYFKHQLQNSQNTSKLKQNSKNTLFSTKRKSKKTRSDNRKSRND